MKTGKRETSEDLTENKQKKKGYGVLGKR